MAKVRVKKGGHNLFSAVIFNNTMRRRSFSELTLPETSITEFKVCFYPSQPKLSTVRFSFHKKKRKINARELLDKHAALDNRRTRATSCN